MAAVGGGKGAARDGRVLVGVVAVAVMVADGNEFWEAAVEVEISMLSVFFVGHRGKN